jgi:hypothetical protein
MNLKEGCPNKGDRSCQVSCKDPTSPNRCVVLQSQLIDGSPCGFGGTCFKGNCQAAGALDTAKAWFTQNLQISIPVTVVAGLVVLGLLWALLTNLRRCCARRRAAVSSEPALSGMRGDRLSSWPEVPGIQVSASPEMVYRGNGSSFNTVPGPPPVMDRRNGPSFNAPMEPPSVLQPGSNEAFSRYPTAVHSSNSSMAARDRSRGASLHRPTMSSGVRQGLPSRPNPIRNVRTSGPQAEWVDESLYNGR